MPEETDENEIQEVEAETLPARAQSKTGMLGSALEASAARDERNDERMYQLMEKQLESAQSQSTLWFRLAMAELLVIVVIAAVILGRAVSVPNPAGGGNIEIGGGPSAAPRVQ